MINSTKPAAKNSFLKLKKKRINWSQVLKTTSKSPRKGQKRRKSLQYILLLKKFNNAIDFTNLKLLKPFLTKYGKIRPRRRTRVNVQAHKKIARSIRKARAFGLIPFTCNVKL